MRIEKLKSSLIGILCCLVLVLAASPLNSRLDVKAFPSPFLVAESFGTNNSIYDFNCDGRVDMKDVATAAVQYSGQSGITETTILDPLEAWSEAELIIWQYNTTHYGCRNMSTLMAQTLSTNLTLVEQYALGNMTGAGLIYLKEVTWNTSLTLTNTVMVVEAYNGTLRYYSNQGKFVLPTLAADPDTSTFGTEMHLWFNSADQKIKFWDGSAVQVLPSVSGGALNTTLAYKYTVWNSSNTYYAMNQAGSIVSIGNDASTVIQYCLSGLTAGRDWQEWIKIEGYMRINSPINVSSYTGVDSKGANYQQNANISAIYQSNNYGTDRVQMCKFLGGVFDGNRSTANTVGSAFRGNFRQTDFADLTIISFAQYGFWLQGYASSKNCDAFRISNCWIGTSATGTGCKLGGVFLDDQYGGTVNDGNIESSFLINNGVAQIIIHSGSQNRIHLNHFAGFAGGISGATRAMGIWMTQSWRTQIVDNHFEHCDKEGIVDNGSSYSRGTIISSNTFESMGYLTNNTYAAIRIGDGGGTHIDYGVIMGNHFITDATENAPIYCIWLRSEATYFEVFGNSAVGTDAGNVDYTAYATAAWKDDGTSNELVHNISGT